ncbi:hypothetical protein QYF61_000122 [Mycteria americana]|uniref:Uncharacterized protein n=1 Tax=Mycteria americana TaxID=33587 RepID=A0AAN7S235_MYCAM|nr:hypothetical protein QYF61_000122 [Mycteria americana]
MCCLGTWLSGGPHSAGLTVGLDDREALFQPRRFHDSKCCLPHTGQKKTPDKKDGRRMSFQKPKGTIEYSDPDGVQQKESAASPAHACVRPTRVVSSTSEEEEAFTEKFLKINCKYITNDKPMEVNGGADIHLQSVEDPMLEQVYARRRL